MSKFDSFLKELESASVLELNELVKTIEEKFGVSAATVAAPASKALLLLFWPPLASRKSL